MRKLVMDNNEKVSSRAKPQTIEVRKLQHDLVASLSGGKFCKLQWILHIQYTTNHRPQLAMATPNNRKKTRFCSITQFLEPIRLGCVILVWCLCVASCELQDLFDTQAHTHTNGLSEHICERHNIRSQQMPQPCHKRWCLNCSWSRPPNAVVRIPLGSYSTHNQTNSAVSCQAQLDFSGFPWISRCL